VTVKAINSALFSPHNGVYSQDPALTKREKKEINEVCSNNEKSEATWMRPGHGNGKWQAMHEAFTAKQIS